MTLVYASNLELLDLGRVPYCYVLYGVKYIDLVSLDDAGDASQS